MLNENNIKIASTMELQNFALTITETGIVFCGENSVLNFWAIILSLLIIAILVLFKIDFSSKNMLKKHKKA